MFILGEIVQALAMLINGVCWIFWWLIVARIVVSWLGVDPYHSVVVFLMQATDPILQPFRRLPLQIGVIDFSPFVAIVTVFLIRDILVGILNNWAHQLGAFS